MFKSPRRKLLVGGNEDNWRTLLAKSGQELKPISSRHLNIKKDCVRGLFLDSTKRFFNGFGGLDVAIWFEHSNHPLHFDTGRAFVINDQNIPEMRVGWHRNFIVFFCPLQRALQLLRGEVS